MEHQPEETEGNGSVQNAVKLFKGLLRDQLGWAQKDLDTTVFHDSAKVMALSGLV